MGGPVVDLNRLYKRLTDTMDEILDGHIANDTMGTDLTIRNAPQINYFEHLKRYHRWDGAQFIGYGWADGGNFAGELSAEAHEAEHDDATRWLPGEYEEGPVFHTHVAEVQ